MNFVAILMVVVETLIEAGCGKLAQRVLQWGAYRGISALVRIEMELAETPSVLDEALDLEMGRHVYQAQECLARLASCESWVPNPDKAGGYLPVACDKTAWVVDTMLNAWAYWLLRTDKSGPSDEQVAAAAREMLEKIQAMEKAAGVASAVQGLVNAEDAKRNRRVKLLAPQRDAILKRVMVHLRAKYPADDLTDRQMLGALRALEQKLAKYRDRAVKTVSITGKADVQAQAFSDSAALIEVQRMVLDAIRPLAEAEQSEGLAANTGELDAREEAAALDFEAAYARQLSRA